MLSDVEIAQEAKLRPITEIAKKAGLKEEDLELYGRYKAKVSLGVRERLKDRPNGKLIYITAITATPAGEGKTCCAIGLTQALGRLNKRVILALREPSLGPVFGIKGGATGGGYSQVLPMEDINLHFTGDIHAVGVAHNLLAALVDNHIYQGNELGIDPRRVLWRRVVDISDRQLRNVIVGLGGKAHGIPRETGFDITVASEVMAILALSKDMDDLKERLGRIVVAYTYDGKLVRAKDLKTVGSMAILLKDALKPNLVQTLEGQPVFIHCGPFANIAHGNNSIIATELALKLADYAITEGGFAADLGAEKFFDIVCPLLGIHPDVVVLVASIRALNIHGGASKHKMMEKNLKVLGKGLANLDKHIENVKKFGLPVIVDINPFSSHRDEQFDLIKEHCAKSGVKAVWSEIHERGGEGGLELANAVLETLENEKPRFKPLYNSTFSLKDKINRIATEIYGAEGVNYTARAESDIETIVRERLENLPINMAKTQLSLTDDPNLKGAPRNWRLTVREIRISAGAGFLVPLTGEMMTMPGLPKHPAAENIDIDVTGKITGLF